MTEEEKNIWKKHCEDFPKIKTWSNEKQETAKKAYLAGYEQGYEDCRHYAHDYYKSKWNDLRKDPNDLPKHNNQILVAFAFNEKTNKFYCFDIANYFDGAKSFITNTSDGNDVNNGKKVIAWCEIS